MEGSKYTTEEIEEGKSAAILAYIPFVCLIPFLKWKENRFAYDHARQGVALFLVELLALILLIPGLAMIFIKLTLAVAIILAGAGIAFAVTEREWKIPIIGDWLADKVEEKLGDL